MSHTRVRLRALASLGLSIIILGALVPATSATSAASTEVSARLAAPAAPTAASAVAPAVETAVSGVTIDAASAALAGLANTIDVPTRSRTVVANAPVGPATVAASTRIIALAETHLGARYQHGATGPRAFDCSGLVYRVFVDAGLGRRIDLLRSASALYAHFRALHMTSTSNPMPGDLVIFGGGSHVGIYIGAGRVVHAMVSGVAITRINAVYPRFTTYIHLGLTTLRLPTSTAAKPAPRGRGRGPRVLSTVRTIVALSLRSAPSTAARRLLVLQPGARLAVIGSSRGLHNLRWLRVIAAGGQIGWVVAGYTR